MHARRVVGAIKYCMDQHYLNGNRKTPLKRGLESGEFGMV